MGVGAADYDEDGFVDIYVANDHTLNYLWHNDGGKRIYRQGNNVGNRFQQAGEATVSMSVDFADFNEDGLLDLFVSDDTYCPYTKMLGNGIYSDKAISSNISLQPPSLSDGRQPSQTTTMTVWLINLQDKRCIKASLR
jgi:hypothetical protein